MHDNKKIVEYLLDDCQLNQDGYVREWRNGQNGLMIAHICALYGRQDMLSILDEKCLLDLNDHRNIAQMTPLELACEYGHLEVCEYLIKKGCDPNRINQVSLPNSFLF